MPTSKDMNLDYKYHLCRKLAEAGVSYKIAKEAFSKKADIAEAAIQAAGGLGALGYIGLPLAAFGVGSAVGAGLYAATSLDKAKAQIQRDSIKDINKELRKARREY